MAKDLNLSDENSPGTLADNDYLSLSVISSEDFDLRYHILNDKWPYRIELQNGLSIELHPANDHNGTFPHFVSLIPRKQVDVPQDDFNDLITTTFVLAKRLSTLYLGSSQFFHVNVNGTSQCSMPEVPHAHIHLFPSREKRLEYFRKVMEHELSKAGHEPLLTEQPESRSPESVEFRNQEFVMSNEVINTENETRQNTVKAIVIGVGLPGRSIGWLHLMQLLDMDSVQVRHIVEPWWLESRNAETNAGREFKAALETLQSSFRDISLHATVNDLPFLNEDETWLAVIACRTHDMLTNFKALVEKGVKYIYLEKPGAENAEQLKEMMEFADRNSVAVVVGYQKIVANYVRQAWETDQEWKNDIVDVAFQHHNPCKPEHLKQIFSTNKEGMLLNQCCHELALWIKKWGIREHDILDVILNTENTELKHFENICDFSKLEFTVTTTHGRNLTLTATRCGGMESSITVRKGINGEERVFPQADDELQKKVQCILAKSPHLAWYYPLFASDYFTLKRAFVDHILAKKPRIPDHALSLSDAASVFSLAASIQPALLAQANHMSEEETCNPYKLKHEIMFTTKDVICKTPTQQRIWYAPDLFDPKCSLLVDVLRPPQERIVFCVDDKVWSIYRSEFENWSLAQGIQLSTIMVPNGERGKNIEVWMHIMNDLMSVDPLRYAEPILAIGGGAVTDTVGFVASVWRRGIPWIRIPTTLLGMIDASVGIKVGVNYLRKNGIGNFHSPRHTFIDPRFLRTNEERHLKAAVGEMLKIGLVYDKRVYELLRSEGKRLIQEKFAWSDYLPCATAKEIISLSIRAMLNCIAPDFYEENLLRVMDFGHTFSRWLERHQEFKLMHGEAVSIDCVFSTLIAEQKGFISAAETDDVLETHRKLGLYVHVQGLELDLYQTAIEQILIHRAGYLRAPLPGPIGNCRWTQKITLKELTGAWHRLHSFLADYPEGILSPDQMLDDNAVLEPAHCLAKNGLNVQPLYGLAPSEKIVRWGILGCGNVAHDFALALQALPNAEITAVAARDPERAKGFAAKHGAGKWCKDYYQLVNDPNLDIIYVATIPKMHRLHAEMAINAGKHVLIEKPLATTIEDAEAIECLARKRGVFCMEGMWMRFFPAVEMAFQLIGRGEIGEIRHVQADFGFDLFADEGNDNTKWAAGAGMNAGVYPTHAAVMILGSELVKLGAVGITDNFGHNMDVEGVIHACFTGKRTATITWSHLVNTLEETNIFGSKGSIRLHSPAHAPTKITISRLDINRRANLKSSSYTHEFPLPFVNGDFFYPNSEGFYYEAAAVQRCILAGLRECPQAPLSESVLVIKIVQHAISGILYGSPYPEFTNTELMNSEWRAISPVQKSKYTHNIK